MNELSKKIVDEATTFACQKEVQWLGPEEYNPKWWEVRDSKIIELVIKNYVSNSPMMGEWESEKIHKLFGLEYRPQMFKNPKEDEGDIFKLKDWDDYVKMGAFIPDDGDGYWATEKEYAYISAWDPKPDWATHVVWFNK
mgnify:CR=1 FL=1